MGLVEVTLGLVEARQFQAEGDGTGVVLSGTFELLERPAHVARAFLGQGQQAAGFEGVARHRQSLLQELRGFAEVGTRPPRR